MKTHYCISVQMSTLLMLPPFVSLCTGSSGPMDSAAFSFLLLYHSYPLVLTGTVLARAVNVVKNECIHSKNEFILTVLIVTWI